MLEILRDPVWQFVGAMLALLAIAVTIWAYFAQRPRKRLLVERVARVPLITVGADRIPGLQITIDGHQIERATVVVVLVRNLGNAPLADSDFESSLTLDFEVGSVVLDAQIAGSTPEHLPVKVERSANLVTFSKNLLNPGDTFECRILVKDSSGNYVPKARIAGVREIETSSSISMVKPIVALVGVAIAVFGALLWPGQRYASMADLRAQELPYAVIILLTFFAVAIWTLGDFANKAQKRAERTVDRSETDT